MSRSKREEETKLLREISSKLDSVISLLKLGQKSTIEVAKSRLLASDLRSKIYNLCDGRRTVSQIVKELRKSQPLVSRYLKELEEGGLIKSERMGKSVYYDKLV
ncbi:MAG: winged helix-turn-helix transcriptional regulator [Candidatus Bathyarchaeota archaeon]